MASSGTSLLKEIPSLSPLIVGTLLVCCLACSCTGGKAAHRYSVSTGGYADLGEQTIVHYKCGSCHNIPGIRDAHGVFGPPLDSIATRTIIGGNFPNLPENLVRWIKSPKSMKPNTAMPDLGLSEQQARDAAAYLETLR